MKALAFVLLVSAVSALWSPSALAALGGTAGVVIPYAGKLEQNGALLTGTFDFQFDVMPDAATAVPCETKTVSNVAVTNGEFALTIPALTATCVKGKDVHLIVGVRTAGGGAFTTLGKQRLTPTLSAMTSGTGDFHSAGLIEASSVSATGGVSAATVNGTQVNATNITLPNAGTITMASLGNGFVPWAITTTGSLTKKLTFTSNDASPQTQVSFDGTLGGGTSIRARAAILASTTPDIAETIPADSRVEAADVVCADPLHAERAVRCTRDSRGVLGVVSDGTSSFLINSHAHDVDAPLTGQPLVLAGRVPVKVSLENGPIHIGDELTVSSTPGVAMRASGPGPVVGIALADFSTTDGAHKKGGTVLCFVKVAEASALQLQARVAELEAERAADHALFEKRIGELEARVPKQVAMKEQP